MDYQKQYMGIHTLQKISIGYQANFKAEFTSEEDKL